MTEHAPLVSATTNETQDLTLDGGAPGEVASLLETTELRWFAAGRPPSDVVSWFTRGGTAGELEERCDAYRVARERGVGVKRRFRVTLELKIRESVGERVVLGSDLVGALEVWRKWSPADGLVHNVGDFEWLDISKRVVKRRFSVNGKEIAFSVDGPAMLSAWCDVEITEIAVGGVKAWTFAFAAFGPTETRRDAIVASWEALMADPSYPEGFESLLAPSCGYPEWLALRSNP